MSPATSSYKYNWRWPATKENVSNSGPPADFITGTLPDLGESAALNRNPSKAPQISRKFTWKMDVRSAKSRLLRFRRLRNRHDA